jgi:hypothetical protein
MALDDIGSEDGTVAVMHCDAEIRGLVVNNVICALYWWRP